MTQHAKTNKYGVKKGTIESWIELRLRKRDTEIADDSGGKSLLATTLIKPQHIHLGKTRVIKDPPAKAAPIRNEKGVISQSFWYL